MRADPKAQLREWLEKHGACSAAREWCAGKTLAEAWAECDEDTWMTWLLERLAKPITCRCDSHGPSECVFSTTFKGNRTPDIIRESFTVPTFRRGTIVCGWKPVKRVTRKRATTRKGAK